MTVRFKKDVKVEELVQTHNPQDNITKVLSKLKQKNMKFSAFEKDSVLNLHKPRDPSQLSQAQENPEILSHEEEEKLNEDSDKEQKKQTEGEAIDSDLEEAKQKKKKGVRQKYYYQRYQGRERNTNLDHSKKYAQVYVSSFKTVTRDQRDYVENVIYILIQIETCVLSSRCRIKPPITIAKADLRRTRNILLTNNDSYDISLPRLLNNSSTIEQSGIFDERSQSMQVNHQKNLSNCERYVYHHKEQYSTLAAQNLSQDDIINQNSTINIVPYKDLKQESPRGNKTVSITPLKIREGWNNAHGLLDLNKQSQRKFVFENLIRVNEYRFNYMHLPNIYSKTKKVVGDVAFGKGSPRKELFEPQPYQPSYNPSFDLVKRKDPKLVNMNIRPMKELYHQLEDD